MKNLTFIILWVASATLGLGIAMIIFNKPDVSTARPVQSESRFISTSYQQIPGDYVQTIKDTVTGKEYVVVRFGHVVEISK